MQRQYNLRNPAVKRLMKEAQELREPTEQYHAQPLEDNLFEWHFTIRGPGDSEFEGGLYHGRIVLPPDYPMKPPSIILLTPNGRFEVNKKICLSISGYHPESWQPSWSIRTALLAIIGFMPTHGAGAIGSLDYTTQERKALAKKSQSWRCQSCGDVSNVLPQVTDASKETSKEAKELASQISFQAEKEKKSSESNDGGVETSAPRPGTSPAAPSPSPTQAQASPSSHSTATRSSPLTNSFQFPPPPFVTNHWPNSPHQTATTTTTTTGPNFGPIFPLPFVTPPFRPMFPPPHFLPGQPGVFPTGWHPAGAPPPYSATLSASNSSAQPSSTTASATTTASYSTGPSVTVPSPGSTNPRTDNSSSTEQARSTNTTSPSMPSSNMRQRHSQSTRAPPPQMRSSATGPAANSSGGTASLLLATVLGLAIGLLLLRRLYLLTNI